MSHHNCVKYNEIAGASVAYIGELYYRVTW